MKKFFISILFIFLLASPLAAPAMWLGGELPLDCASENAKKNSQVINQQHILELCRAEKKDTEPCKVINNVFQRSPEWFRMSLLKRLWHYNKIPMPADISRGILYRNAREFGAIQMDWDMKRIDAEASMLCDEYDKKSELNKK